ncbi:hypothetical protein EGW08_021998 [Elysia chlorotica]|uniref:C-type lectin domain-containing protein n=1 Tax=Elysia chlorotica TaxID=188477 RepID=A0A3S1AY47_ELYCH|nr:hypothetical protein EGW08_021998 [Elysia chlorotica]
MVDKVTNYVKDIVTNYVKEIETNYVKEIETNYVKEIETNYVKEWGVKSPGLEPAPFASEANVLPRGHSPHHLLTMEHSLGADEESDIEDGGGEVDDDEEQETRPNSDRDSRIAAASSNTRGVLLRQTSYLDCQTWQIGDSWVAPSIFACSFRCMNTENCQAVVFNEASGLCRLGSVAFGPMVRITDGIPETGSLDKIYYIKQPAPPCDTANNFAIYDKCGTSACLYLSTSNSNGYNDAKTLCSQMNSSLYVGNTMAKFSLFWHVTKYIINDNTFIGLNDIEVEGTFVWENGEPLSAEQNLYIWHGSEPNDFNGAEDCVDVKHRTWGNARALTDESCYSKIRYVCERCEQC